MPLQPEARLYLERARLALAQSRDNLGLDYYDVAIGRAYYSRELAEDILGDAERFVKRAASYLEEHDV